MPKNNNIIIITFTLNAGSGVASKGFAQQIHQQRTALKFHEIPPHKNKSSKRIETHNLKYYANNDHHDNYAAGPKLGVSKKEEINKMIYVLLGMKK